MQEEVGQLPTDSDCCVVGKGHVRQLIRGLPVSGGEQQYLGTGESGKGQRGLAEFCCGFSCTFTCKTPTQGQNLSSQQNLSDRLNSVLHKQAWKVFFVCPRPTYPFFS